MWTNEDKEKKLFMIEIDYEERDQLVPELIKMYQSMTNINGLITVKRLLECMDVNVTDWTPHSRLTNI